jgi:hypothetical protein
MPSKALRQSYRHVSPPVLPSMLCISARLKNLSSLSSSYLQNRLSDLHRPPKRKKKRKQNKLCGSYLKTVTWFAGERQISTGRVPRKLETDMRTCTALTPSSGIEPPGGILPHLAMESNHTHTMLSVVYLCTFSTIDSTGCDTYTVSGYTVLKGLSFTTYE